MSDPDPLPSWKTDVGALRPFSKISLIVMDLDGTYLESGSSETQEIKALLRKLRYRDIEISLATGRALNGVEDIAENLEIGKPLILYNGSVVINSETKDCIYERKISNTTLKSILWLLRGRPVITYAYEYNGPTKITDSSYSGPVEQVLGWGNQKQPQPDRDPNGLLVNWQNSFEADGCFEPNSIVIDGTGTPDALRDVQELLAGVSGITFIPSREPYLEIRPAGSDKGTALQFVANELGIPREEILTIGDNDNDAEMLSWAGIGVSVKTASEKALDSSDFYCEHGVTSAVIEVLRQVIAAHRYYNIKDREGVI